jgi:amicyanin
MNPRYQESKMKKAYGLLCSVTVAAALLMGAVQAAEPAAANTVQVAILGYKYDPPVLTVPVGTTVVWTNRDDVPHTVTSTDKTFKSSAALDQGDSYSYTFTAAGTYNYYCTVHPFMTAKVIVQDAKGG